MWEEEDLGSMVMSTLMSDEGGRKLKGHKKKRQIRWARLILLVALLVITVGGGIAAGFVAGALRAMPAVDVMDIPQARLTSFMYDRNGQPVTELFNEQNRIPVDIDDLPEYVPDAFIAIEDERFQRHFGVDILGILRATYNNFRGGHVQGASTITQQLVRNAFPQVGTERTYQRKLQEAVVAIELDRRYTKKQILEMYLNQIHFGYNAYGIASASHLYFDKDARQLTLAEAALLAGLPKAPNDYSPHVNLDAARRRQQLVLDKMVEQGYIGAEEAARAKEVPILPPPTETGTTNRNGTGTKPAELIQIAALRPYGEYPAPHFVDYVVDRLLSYFTDQLGNQKAARDLVFAGGLKIYTTLDPAVQAEAQKAIAEILDPVFPIKEGQRYPEAAAVVMEPDTGYIRAMVGGRTHSKMRELNRAYQAYRQPGSAFKPLAVYAPALSMGYTAASVFDDSPVVYDKWVPMNYDEKLRGLTTIREAVRRSVNVVAVRVLEKIGVKNGVEFAGKLGIESLDLDLSDDGKSDLNLATALGGLTKGVTPLEMTRAYATIANGGVRVVPTALVKVVDRNGKVLLDNTGPGDQEVVMDEGAAYVMTDILRGVSESQPAGGWIENFGTGPRAREGKVMSRWPVAGKTGTTSDVKDIWFVGYTPRFAGSVWIGYDNPPERIRNGAGGLWPAMIWNRMMTAAHRDLEPADFPRPDNIVKATVCIQSGELPGPDCPSEYRRNEIFVEGTQPTEIKNSWKPVQVLKLDPERLAGQEELLKRYPSLRLNPYVLWDENCTARVLPETRVMLDRPPVDMGLVEQAARLLYGSKYTPARALGLVPADAARALPQVACSDIAGLFPPPNPGDAPAGGGPDTGPQPGRDASYTLEIQEKVFSPRMLEVFEGQRVRLMVTNHDEVTHRLVFPTYGIATDIPAGETVEVAFVAERQGIFQFSCDIHGAGTMQGRLLVRRPADAAEKEDQPGL